LQLPGKAKPQVMRQRWPWQWAAGAVSRNFCCKLTAESSVLTKMLAPHGVLC
jgi:hypothetical protein